MPPVEFEGKRYHLTRASDPQRDGMALELDDVTDGAQELVLYAFYSDRDRRMTLTAFRHDLPFSLVEWFISRAHELLPPRDPAGWLRRNLIGLLQTLASKEKQREYQREVPFIDVPGELICQWFDDLYHPEDALFQEVFSARERSALAAFDRFFKSRVEHLPASPGAFDE